VPGSATRASAYGGTGRSSFGSRLGLHGTLRFALDRQCAGSKTAHPFLRPERSHVAVSTSDLQLIATITVLSCDEGHFSGRIVLGSVYENLF